MPTTDAVNPYSAPTAAIEALAAQPTYPSRYISWSGRIDRMRYLGYSSLTFLLLIAITMTVDVALMDNSAKTWPVAVYAGCNIGGTIVLPLLAHGIYARRRLHDLGLSGWLAILACIPGIGLALAVYLTFAAGAPEPNDHGPAAKSGRLTLIWLLPISIASVILVLAGIGIGETIYNSYLYRTGFR